MTHHQGHNGCTWYLYVSFILFGLAYLLPWNVYMKSVPYFRTRLSDLQYAPTVGSFMSSSYTFFNFLTMIFLVVFRWDEFYFGISSRIVIGMVGNALLMLIMVILATLPLKSMTLFTLVLVVSGTAGAVTACFMKGLLGMTARFPRNLTPAALGGQAAAGFLVSVANFFTVITKEGKSDNSMGLVAYFSVGSITLLISLIVFVWNYYQNEFFRSRIGIVAEDSGQNLKATSKLRQKTPSSMLIKVFWKILWYALGLSATLAVTVSIYATFVTSPRLSPPSGLRIVNGLELLYTPFVFLIYDFGDIIGRWLPAIPILAGHAKSLRIKLSPWLRMVVFIPLFVFLAPVNVTANGINNSKVVHFGMIDVIYMAILFFFGVSNGYCCTVLLLHAPNIAASRDDGSTTFVSINDSDDTLQLQEEDMKREISGPLMGLFLNIGLLVGSLTSFLWQLVL